MTMKNILFCIPWYIEWNSVKRSLDRLSEYSISPRQLKIGDNLITVQELQNVYVGISRNYFVTGRFQIDLEFPQIRKFDEWIFCDSDIEFFEKHLLRILDLDYPVVSLPYRLKSKKPAYCTKIDGHHLPLTTKGFKKVDGHGAGGLLKIQRQVFETILPYWFFIEKTIEDGILDFETEDFSFCQKARDAGFDLWVDFDYPLIHNNPKLKEQKMEQPRTELPQTLDGNCKAVNKNVIAMSDAYEALRGLHFQKMEEKDKEIADLKTQLQTALDTIKQQSEKLNPDSAKE